MFYLLGERLLADGDEKTFIRLLNDRKAVVRSMGIYVLARSGQRADAIVRLVDDREQVPITYTCVGEQTTVGTLALQLLHDPGFLDLEEGRQPLIDAQPLSLIIIHALATDGRIVPRAVRAYAREHLAPLLTPTAARDGVADLSGLQFIKGVARAGPSVAARRFLTACMDDVHLPAARRLAAASGLTRDGDPAALAALERNVDLLNRLSGGRPGSRFVNDAKVRATLQPYLDEVEKRGGVDRIPDEVAALSHPMLLEVSQYVGLSRLFGIDFEELDGRVLPVLDRLDECAAPWDTYSDARLHADRVARTSWPKFDAEADPDQNRLAAEIAKRLTPAQPR